MKADNQVIRKVQLLKSKENSVEKIANFLGIPKNSLISLVTVRGILKYINDELDINAFRETITRASNAFESYITVYIKKDNYIINNCKDLKLMLNDIKVYKFKSENAMPTEIVNQIEKQIEILEKLTDKYKADETINKYTYHKNYTIMHKNFTKMISKIKRLYPEDTEFLERIDNRPIPYEQYEKIRYKIEKETSEETENKTRPPKDWINVGYNYRFRYICKRTIQELDKRITNREEILNGLMTVPFKLNNDYDAFLIKLQKEVQQLVKVEVTFNILINAILNMELPQIEDIVKSYEAEGYNSFDEVIPSDLNIPLKHIKTFCNFITVHDYYYKFAKCSSKDLIPHYEREKNN